MNGGTLIDTSALNHVLVDPITRSVRVGAGATFAEVVAAAAQHGLAPLSGSFPGVGVTGLTLNGGIGVLSRAHGFTADSVLGAELVTVDGAVHRLGPDDDSDVFWGLRGAGSMLGIITELHMCLYPVAEILGGSLLIDLERHPEAVAIWRNWADDLDRNMMTALTLLSAPSDSPDLPPFMRGVQQLRIQLAWSGEPAVGQRLIERLRSDLSATGITVEGSVSLFPYSRTPDIFAEPDEPHPYGSEAFMLSELTDSALMRIVESSAPERVPSLTVIGVRRLGGAMAEAPASPSVLGHRDAEYMVSVLSPLGHEESSPLSHHLDILAALRSDASDPMLGRALNFTFRGLAPHEVASAFNASDLERLRRLRDSVDPDRILLPQFAV